MANQYISTKRTEQGALAASGSTLVPCVDSGASTVHTVDELAIAMGGYTVPTISQSSVRSCRLGIQDLSAAVIVPTSYMWTLLDHDDGGWWSVGEPSRLTIPVGVTKVIISSSFFLGGGVTHSSIIKNGSVLPLCRDESGSEYQSLTTGVLKVVAGDYFEVYLTGLDGGAPDNIASWFSIVEVEGAP